MIIRLNMLLDVPQMQVLHFQDLRSPIHLQIFVILHFRVFFILSQSNSFSISPT